MVVSNINENISYTEIKTIDENDKGRDVTMFQINIFTIPVIIALGEIKYKYVDQNILFVPVYLVVDETSKIYQIGLYEFDSKELENLKDEDGDLDISEMEGPLLYSFVDKPYIQKCMKNETLIPDYDSGDDEEEEEEELEDLPDEDTNEEDEKDEKDEKEEQKEGKNPPPVLVELNIEEDDDDFLQKGEEEKDEKREKKKYKKPDKSESQWIQQFMTNNNYGILDNPGHGDCFFYTIRDAFRYINVDASVEKIRNLLSDKVEKSDFDNYKERYDMLNNEIKTLKRQIPQDKKRKKQMAKDYNKLAKEAKKEKDVPTKKQKIKNAKKLKVKHTDLGEELKHKEKELELAKENFADIAWFKNIETIDQLKEKIKTCDFWADNWAIGVLELAINVKFIILSSSEYKKGNYSRVLSCGDFVPNVIEDKGYFKPKYYIIVEHTGNHYKLITYKDKQIYRFHEIPYGMKAKIIETCMKSRGKSIYNYIPKFAKLIGETIEIPLGENKEEKNEIKIETEIDESKDNIDEVEENPEMTPTPSPDDQNLFDDNTVFYFHSKSADKKPGKGKGKAIEEKIRDEDVDKYKELASIKDWRRILSNFYTKPKENDVVQPLFELDGLKWASVEHYYHANKFRKNNPDYYRLFSIDSGSTIMDDPRKALGAGGKTGKVANKKFRPRDVVMDPDFFDNKNNERIMEKAQNAKYRQDELCRRTLLATRDAKLVHYIKSRKPASERPPPVVFYDTMRIRKKLKAAN